MTELIAVLDCDTAGEASERVAACGACRWYKIGLQLFTRCGPSVVEAIRHNGHKVFLDLKLHDIPNTVSHAAKAVADLGASFTTVHATGGARMVAAAREAVEGTETRILAVTVLTSLTDEALAAETGIREPAAHAVPRLAKMAVEAGAHGVVCSPLELGAVRAAIGTDPAVVTPGVRPAWAAKDDQARVTTPRQAAEAGADYVVVGRPIFSHESPPEAVRLIQEELAP